MNKELIKKYFEEFKHWLNGGKVISKYTLLSEWSDCQDENIWRIPSKNITEVLIVIDDYYVEFRKALAEGKTIEYLGYKNEWKNLTENCRKLEGVCLSKLRIKPEEPKFKVGDWLVNTKYHSSKPFLVDEIWVNHIKEHGRTIGGTTVKTGNLKDFEIWQPAIGEWCVMYDTEEDPNANSITLQKWDGKGKWTPIPFIGQLPTYIKNSDES